MSVPAGQGKGQSAVTAALSALASALPADTPWALVGGMAVSSRAEPRFTRDVDVAVAVPDDSRAEQLVAGLVGSGWQVRAVVEQELVDRLAQVRLMSQASGGIFCDLLFASSGIEHEVVRDAERLELVPGVVVPVAQAGHLIVLKLLSVDDRRLQDLLDLQALAQVADDVEWSRAGQAAALVTQRGFNRGRDLPSALQDLRAGIGPG